jgi:putative transposase
MPGRGREAADKKAKPIVDNLRASKMGKVADLGEQAVHETLTYDGFPDIHWQKIITNNPLEQIMKEIRRRTHVVGAPFQMVSPLSLAAARLRHIAGTMWSAKCSMNMRPFYQQQLSETEAVA